MIFHDFHDFPCFFKNPAWGSKPAPEALRDCQKLRKPALTHQGDLFVSQTIRNDPETIQEASNNVWGDIEGPKPKFPRFSKNGLFF